MSLDKAVVSKLAELRKHLPKEVEASLDVDRSFFNVDPYEARVEVAELPASILYAIELADNLRAVRERKESKLKELEARLYLDCREFPEKFGLSKPTEKTIESIILVRPEVMELRNEILEISSAERLAFATKEALRYRKDILLAILGSKNSDNS